MGWVRWFKLGRLAGQMAFLHNPTPYHHAYPQNPLCHTTIVEPTINLCVRHQKPTFTVSFNVCLHRKWRLAHHDLCYGVISPIQVLVAFKNTMNMCLVGLFYFCNMCLYLLYTSMYLTFFFFKLSIWGKNGSSRC